MFGALSDVTSRKKAQPLAVRRVRPEQPPVAMRAYLVSAVTAAVIVLVIGLTGAALPLAVLLCAIVAAVASVAAVRPEVAHFAVLWFLLVTLGIAFGIVVRTRRLSPGSVALGVLFVAYASFLGELIREDHAYRAVCAKYAMAARAIEPGMSRETVASIAGPAGFVNRDDGTGPEHWCWYSWKERGILWVNLGYVSIKPSPSLVVAFDRGGAVVSVSDPSSAAPN